VIDLGFIYQLSPITLLLTLVTTVLACALALDWIFMLGRIKPLRGELTHLTTAVATVVGAMFALSMSFLASSVWTTEDKARDTVYAEARAIDSINIYLDYAAGPVRNGILRNVNDYGRAVAAEWDNMADAPGYQSDAALREIYAAVILGFSESEQSRMVQQRLLIALDSLSAARQERLSIAQDSIRSSQWLLIAGLGLLLLVTLAASHAAFPLAQRVGLGLISLAISIMLFGIIIHDKPFVGEGAVKPDPILKAAGVLS
jgi:hypothetical protein